MFPPVGGIFEIDPRIPNERGYKNHTKFKKTANYKKVEGKTSSGCFRIATSIPLLRQSHMGRRCITSDYGEELSTSISGNVLDSVRQQMVSIKLLQTMENDLNHVHSVNGL